MKKQQRVQKPKPIIGRSEVRASLVNKTGGGIHKPKNAYKRKPKHGTWE